MRLQKLLIRGFKSIYEQSFEPRAFSALVGPNNAGKSTLMEAIDFVGDIHRHGLEIALNRRGGFDNVAHRRMRRTKQPLRFEVAVTLSLREALSVYALTPKQEKEIGLRRDSSAHVSMRHVFEIKAANESIDSDFRITNEWLEVELGEEMVAYHKMRVERLEAGYEVSAESFADVDKPLWDMLVGMLASENGRAALKSALPPRTDLLTRGFPFSPVLHRFVRWLQSIRLYRLSAPECRRPGVPTPNVDLEQHGGNLPGLVWHMSHHFKPQWAEVLDTMRKLVPGLERITSEYTHDRRLYLAFHEAGVGRAWTSDEVSDGTIHALAMFATLHDPRSSVFMIEEPENAVHPWIVRHFVDLCRSASATKQILLSTHSAPLIDYLTPDEVVLITRREGRTLISPLTREVPAFAEDWTAGKFGVFEFLDSGILPSAVPGGGGE